MKIYTYTGYNSWIMCIAATFLDDASMGSTYALIITFVGVTKEVFARYSRGNLRFLARYYDGERHADRKVSINLSF